MTRLGGSVARTKWHKYGAGDGKVGKALVARLGIRGCPFKPEAFSESVMMESNNPS